MFRAYPHWGNIGAISGGRVVFGMKVLGYKLELYWDNGKQNGNY